MDKLNVVAYLRERLVSLACCPLVAKAAEVVGVNLLRVGLAARAPGGERLVAYLQLASADGTVRASDMGDGRRHAAELGWLGRGLWAEPDARRASALEEWGARAEGWVVSAERAVHTAEDLLDLLVAYVAARAASHESMRPRLCPRCGDAGR